MQVMTRLAYPTMFALHDPSGPWGEAPADGGGGGGVALPPTVGLSMAFMSDQGAYLIDNGRVFVLWVGRAISPQWCLEVRRAGHGGGGARKGGRRRVGRAGCPLACARAPARAEGGGRADMACVRAAAPLGCPSVLPPSPAPPPPIPSPHTPPSPSPPPPPPRLALQVFGMEPSALPQDASAVSVEPGRPDAPMSRRLNAVLKALRSGRPLYQQCFVVRQGSPMEVHVVPYFVEDRTQVGGGGAGRRGGGWGGLGV